MIILPGIQLHTGINPKPNSAQHLKGDTTKLNKRGCFFRNLFSGAHHPERVYLDCLSSDWSGLFSIELAACHVIYRAKFVNLG